IGSFAPALVPVVIGIFAGGLVFLTPFSWWFGLLTGVLVSAALLWFASQMRRGSLLTTRCAAWTFSVGGLLLVGWQSLAGKSPIIVMLIAFVPTILAGSSWWALHIARRVYSRFPEWLSRPHATRRLSLPPDARALRAVVAGLLGGLYVLGALCI